MCEREREKTTACVLSIEWLCESVSVGRKKTCKRGRGFGGRGKREREREKWGVHGTRPRGSLGMKQR